jgi:hypothetical protein
MVDLGPLSNEPWPDLSVDHRLAIFPPTPGDDWPYVLHADVVSALPASIRHEFLNPDDLVLAQRIVVGGPDQLVVLDAKGVTTVHLLKP